MTDKEFATLGFMFSKGFKVRNKGQIMGQGVFWSDLEKAGFKKQDLRKLVKDGAIKEIHTVYEKAWRKTYVLPDGQSTVSEGV